MLKVDLHTHSVASPDGGISESQYQQVLSKGILDCIAITDHNEIDFAIDMNKKFGDKIIVGEEIMTTQGEIIGLFLTKKVLSGLSVQETVKQIREQGALVYIPHPFETFRHGLSAETLKTITKNVDIMEVYNGRAFAQNRSQQAAVWARTNKTVAAASSDAHGIRGLGKTYTEVSELPTKENLIDIIATGLPKTGRPSLQALLYPKYFRLRKKLRGKQ